MSRPSTTLNVSSSFAAVASLALMVASALALAASLGATTAEATPISYTSIAGSTYSQDFDTLASSPQNGNVTWTDGTTVAGWYADSNGSVPATYKVNNGTTANTLGVHSNGSVGGGGTNPDSDRALGTQSNTSSNMRLGVAFTNNTGISMISFTATYDGEQWRRINNEGADDYVAEYQIFDAGLGSVTVAGGWTALPGMTFNAPSVSIGGGTVSLDGNNPAFRVAGLTETITGINWGNGQDLWIRFTDTGSAQHQLAIDDFSFNAQIDPSAIPEPSSFLLLGLGAMGLMRHARRRQAKA